MASMPSANPMLVDLNEMENVFKKLFELLEKNSKRTSIFLHDSRKNISSLAKKSKNLVITSCVEIRNKDLHDEIERISKESKDVSNESKTADTNVFADEEKRATLGKLNAFDKENCDFRSKVTHLEKIIAQKSKDFDDVKLELSNRTSKFEAYSEKLKSTKVVLERQLARKIDDSKAKKYRFLKEINHLRTQLENLKRKRVETKLDNSSILGKTLLLNNERNQLLKQIAFLESKFASQDIRSCLKEYHELRT
ncbi:hypothetical protein Tco_0153662 [Tanacetum coccineum]